MGERIVFRTLESATRALVGTAARQGIPHMKTGGAATAGSQSTQELDVACHLTKTRATCSLATLRPVRHFLKTIVVPTAALMVKKSRKSSSLSLPLSRLLPLLAPLVA